MRMLEFEPGFALDGFLELGGRIGVEESNDCIVLERCRL